MTMTKTTDDPHWFLICIILDRWAYRQRRSSGPVGPVPEVALGSMTDERAWAWIERFQSEGFEDGHPNRNTKSQIERSIEWARRVAGLPGRVASRQGTWELLHMMSEEEAEALVKKVEAEGI